LVLLDLLVLVEQLVFKAYKEVKVLQVPLVHKGFKDLLVLRDHKVFRESKVLRELQDLLVLKAFRA
jgi:phytoene/squalene synthetase